MAGPYVAKMINVDDEINYYDKFMTDLKEGEGLSLVSLTADIALEFTEVQGTIKNLLDILERKGVMSADDRNELSANIVKTVDEKLRAAAKKHSELAGVVGELDTQK
jgi:hypothetical protein